jgi:hypothetical protein
LFVDNNANGQRDAGEWALARAGVTVFLDANQDGYLNAGEISTTTDTTGAYTFTGLTNGTYTLAQLTPSNYLQTTPTTFPVPGAGLLGNIHHDISTPESGTVPNVDANYAGLAWANGSLFVTESSGAPNRLYQVDPVTGNPVGPAASIPDDIWEITFDGSHS